MTFSTSEVAICCSSASERCPASSRVRASSCFFNSLSELGLLLTHAFAFVPVERSLRARVGLFARLRDKVTSSAQPLVPPLVGPSQGSSLSILTDRTSASTFCRNAKLVGSRCLITLSAISLRRAMTTPRRRRSCLANHRQVLKRLRLSRVAKAKPRSCGAEPSRKSGGIGQINGPAVAYHQNPR